MARIVVAVARYTSHVLSVVGLARRLQARGDEILVLGEPAIADRVAERGLPFEAMPVLHPTAVQPGGPEDGADDDEAPVPAAAPAAAESSSGAERTERARAATAALWGLVDDAPHRWADLVDRFRPDLAIFDPFVLAHAIPLRPLGVPVAAFSSKPLLVPAPDVPPVTTHVRPGRSLPARLRVRGAWYRQRRADRRREALWARRAARTGYSLRALLDRYAAVTPGGFPVEDELDERWIWFDFHFRSVPEIVLHAREFDFPRRHPSPPDLADYAGPCVDTHRDPDFRPADLGIEDDRPLVYATVGTVTTGRQSAWFDFIRRVVDAFASDPGIALVLSVGDEASAARLGSLPDHVVARAFVPQVGVLRHASAAITHGGAATLRESYALGVPILGAPARLDRPGNIARVVHAGIGLRLDFRHASAAGIAAGVRRLLDPDEPFAERAAALRDASTRADERGDAGRIVDRFIAERRFLAASRSS